MDRALIIGSIVFVAFMILIHRVVAPMIVAHYGIVGTIAVCSACMGLATVFDRR